MPDNPSIEQGYVNVLAFFHYLATGTAGKRLDSSFKSSSIRRIPMAHFNVSLLVYLAILTSTLASLNVLLLFLVCCCCQLLNSPLSR